MSSFPFRPEKYRKYQNTFLQKVTIGFDFGSSQVDKIILNNEFNDYLQRFFGINSNGDIASQTWNVSKKDSTLSFDFSSRHTVVNFSGQSYVSFSDTAIPQIYKLRDFFKKVVRIDKISKTMIRKVNVFNIKYNKEEEINVSEVRGLIFSKEFLSALNTDNLTEQERKIPHFCKCEFFDDESLIKIRTALMPPSSESDEFYHVILDTVACLRPSNGINVDEIAEKLMDFNSILYYSYHWCISDNIKRVMLESQNAKSEN